MASVRDGHFGATAKSYKLAGSDAGKTLSVRVTGSQPGYTSVTKSSAEPALVDTDDTIKEVYGYKNQGSGYGYSGVRGLNALIGTVTTNDAAPVTIGARLRTGGM